MSAAEWAVAACAYLAGVVLLTRRCRHGSVLRSPAAASLTAVLAGILWPALLAGYLELRVPWLIWRGARWLLSGDRAPSPSGDTGATHE